MSSIGFGIIGCGNIAGVHAQSIVEIDGAELVGVANVPGHSGADKMAETYGTQAFDDFHELLKRDDVDVVCLCVPSGARLETAVACAEAGKHIIAEKPLEVTTERIDALIAAVDKAGVKLGCIFQYRFANGPQHIRQAIDAGRFGKLVLGDAYIKWYRSQEYYESGGWRGTCFIEIRMNHYINLLEPGECYYLGKVEQNPLYKVGAVAVVLALIGLVYLHYQGLQSTIQEGEKVRVWLEQNEQKVEEAKKQFAVQNRIENARQSLEGWGTSRLDFPAIFTTLAEAIPQPADRMQFTSLFFDEQGGITLDGDLIRCSDFFP